MNEGGLRLTVSVNISADPVFQVTKLSSLLLEISTPDANEVVPSVPKVQVLVEVPPLFVCICRLFSDAGA